MSKQKNTINILNKKARFNYELLDDFIAGLVLTGTEIKSIREGKASIVEGYCYISKGEAFIKNVHIAEYTHGGYENHDPNRERKLLLNKKEIEKIQKKIGEKGLTLIPTRLFIDNNGRAKLKIALGKGKKLHDKRETLKKRDDEMKINRLTR